MALVANNNANEHDDNHSLKTTCVGLGNLDTNVSFDNTINTNTYWNHFNYFYIHFSIWQSERIDLENEF